jgi:hypothetical protein
MTASDVRALSIFAHAEAALKHFDASTRGSEEEKLEVAESLDSALWTATFDAVGAPFSEAAKQLVLDELARRVKAAASGRQVG